MIPAEGNYTLSIFSPGYTPISIDTPLSFGENDFSYSLNLSTPTPTPIPTPNSGGRGSVRYVSTPTDTPIPSIININSSSSPNQDTISQFRSYVNSVIINIENFIKTIFSNLNRKS